MVSMFYLLSIIASYFILMQICSSMVVDDRYYSSLSEIGNNDEQEHGQNDDQLYVAQRSAHFIFPPTSLIYPLNQINDYRDFHPIKRQSFGRKHHWDAFFGRR